VTREGILKLDQQMLDAWKEQLESRWGDALSSGSFPGWAKIWSRGLGKLNGLEGKK